MKINKLIFQSFNFYINCNAAVNNDYYVSIALYVNAPCCGSSKVAVIGIDINIMRNGGIRFNSHLY